MRLIIEPTDEIVDFHGVRARVWKGLTPKGVPCLLIVARVAVDDREPDQSEFSSLLDAPPEPELKRDLVERGL